MTVPTEFALHPSEEGITGELVLPQIALQYGRAEDLPSTGHRHALPVTLRNSASSSLTFQLDVASRYSSLHRFIAASSSPVT